MPSNRLPLIAIVFVVLLLAFAGFFFWLGNSKNIDTKTTDTEVKKSSMESSICSSTLTSPETNTVGSWKTYTNSTEGYSFKHPADWETAEQGATSIILSNNTALFSFQFGVVDEPHGGMLELSREGVVAACENTEKVSLTGQPPGGENFRRVVTQINKNGKVFTALLTFRFVDDETSNGLKENYDLILKTIEFD